MRKNMYYLLFPLYAMVLVFILYINGVFTGEVTSAVNVLINVGFLLVIGILFVISAVSFNRLNQFTKALESVSEDMEREYKEKQSCLWEEYGTRKHIFKNEALDKAFYKYQKRMSGYQTRRGLVAVCDLEEYINEELMERVAMTHYTLTIFHKVSYDSIYISDANRRRDSLANIRNNIRIHVSARQGF